MTRKCLGVHHIKRDDTDTPVIVSVYAVTRMDRIRERQIRDKVIEGMGDSHPYDAVPVAELDAYARVVSSAGLENLTGFNGEPFDLPDADSSADDLLVGFERWMESDAAITDAIVAVIEGTHAAPRHVQPDLTEAEKADPKSRSGGKRSESA